MLTPTMVDQLDSSAPHSWRDAIPSEDKYGYGVMLFSNYESGMVGHNNYTSLAVVMGVGPHFTC